MKRALTALTASTVTAAGLVAFASSASAEEIDGAITGVTTSESTTVGDVFILDALWKVPDGSQEGDTFTLQLPERIRALSSDFEVVDPETNDVVGKASAHDGVVVVTLTDYVTENPLNLTGSLHFYARVSSDATPGEPITIDWGNGKTTVTPKSPTTPELERSTKYGWATDLGGNGWSIEVPGDKAGAVVTDTAHDQTITCPTVKIFLGTREGTAYPTSFQPVDTSSIGVTCLPQSLTVELGDISADQVYRISYESVAEEGKDVVENDYNVTSDVAEQGGTASSRVYRASGTGSGNPTPTPTPTPSETPSEKPSETPSATPSATPSTTPSATPSSSAPVVPPSTTTAPPRSAAPTATRTPAPTATRTAAPSTRHALPRTGSELLPLAVLGGGLVLAGLGALTLARRRS